MRKIYLSLFIIFFNFLNAQDNETFGCYVDNTSFGNSVYFNPLNKPHVYSGSTDVNVLASFEPISFDIYFWIVQPKNSSEREDDIVTYKHIEQNLIRINQLFRPMNICFVLKGYDYIDTHQIYENTSYGAVLGYANANGKFSNNSLNVYVVKTLNGYNGAASANSDGIVLKRSHFIGKHQTIPGNLLAHEIAHTYGLAHPWGEGLPAYTFEHVTRDSNNPNYNALTAGDCIADTPAMVSFWSEFAVGGSIFDVIDPYTCEYLGNGTDVLGVPFELTPNDVGNVMGYTWQPCIDTGFTIGQGIRLREYIADPSNSYRPSIKAKRNDVPNIDLYMKDDYSDFGIEPNINSQYIWNSKDIWVRNQTDLVEEHQNPIYHPTSINYVYVRIYNRGCSPSNGKDKVRLYWSKSVINPEWDFHWKETNTFSNGAPVGGFIGEIAIPQIESGGSVVLSIPWTSMPNPNFYGNLTTEPWNFSILARIVSEDDPVAFPEVENLSVNVRNNNNLALKNVNVVDLRSTLNPFGSVLALDKSASGNVSIEFNVNDFEQGYNIFEEAEIVLTLDNSMLDAWIEGGQILNQIERVSHNKFIVKNQEAYMNFNLNEESIGIMDLKIHFLTKNVTEKNNFELHVVQKDLDNNIVLGGETYNIIKGNRQLFNASVINKELNTEDMYLTLSANNIDEEAVYNWYDEEGNLLYEGLNFSTFAQIGQKFKLEVLALNDGYKDYLEVEVSQSTNNSLSIHPNPATDKITVSYIANSNNSAYLSIIPMNNVQGVFNNYLLNTSEDQIEININNYLNGYYIVSLIIDGEVVNSKIFVKQ
ncbi:MAG: hypothetical protein Q4B43_03950 [Bacteroidota bacterium]|nr:hypothetical protein [Bacteroidota bacterium]